MVRISRNTPAQSKYGNQRLKTDVVIETTITAPILGMHRSGTSMFTRLMNLMGMDLGRVVLRAQFDNPLGFWEDKFLVKSNVRILETMRRDATGFGPYGHLISTYKSCRDLELNQGLSLAIKNYLTGTFGGKTWGWKDPRTVLLYPLWCRLMESFGMSDIRPMIIVRHPQAVIRSMLARPGLFELSKACGMDRQTMCNHIWRAYNDILWQLSHEQSCFVGIYEWFLDPDRIRSESERAATYLSLDTSSVDAVVEWIDPKRSHAKPNDANADDEALMLYDQFVKLANWQRDAFLSSTASTPSTTT